MELWIRSQDKDILMLTNTIAVAEDEEGSILGYGIDKNAKALLGTYKTKERALEVLDEIQEHMSNIKRLNYIDAYRNNNNKEFDEVYQMPKE